MNWGVKIGLVYTAFVVMMLFFVFRATSQRNDLVTKDYYGKEGDFTKNIVLAANNAHLTVPVTAAYEVESHTVVIQFPAEMHEATGDAYFYRPSDERLDQHFAIQPGADGLMTVPTTKLPSGRWVLKLSWKASEQDYYYETDLVTP